MGIARARQVALLINLSSCGTVGEVGAAIHDEPIGVSYMG